jgi:hypothetical protein
MIDCEEALGKAQPFGRNRCGWRRREGDLLGAKRSSVSIYNLTYMFMCQDVACIIALLRQVIN